MFRTRSIRARPTGHLPGGDRQQLTRFLILGSYPLVRDGTGPFYRPLNCRADRDFERVNQHVQQIHGRALQHGSRIPVHLTKRVNHTGMTIDQKTRGHVPIEQGVIGLQQTHGFGLWGPRDFNGLGRQMRGGIRPVSTHRRHRKTTDRRQASITPFSVQPPVAIDGIKFRLEHADGFTGPKE